MLFGAELIKDGGPNARFERPVRLEEIGIGNGLTAVEPTLIVSVVAVMPIADGTIQLVYKTPDGTLRDRLLSRVDEADINLATVERPWSFDGNSEASKLAVEAKRIDLAFLFDPMMAVPTSNCFMPADPHHRVYVIRLDDSIYKH